MSSQTGIDDLGEGPQCHLNASTEHSVEELEWTSRKIEISPRGLENARRRHTWLEQETVRQPAFLLTGAETGDLRWMRGQLYMFVIHRLGVWEEVTCHKLF